MEVSRSSKTQNLIRLYTDIRGIGWHHSPRHLITLPVQLTMSIALPSLALTRPHPSRSRPTSFIPFGACWTVGYDTIVRAINQQGG